MSPSKMPHRAGKVRKGPYLPDAGFRSAKMGEASEKSQTHVLSLSRSPDESFSRKRENEAKPPRLSAVIRVRAGGWKKVPPGESEEKSPPSQAALLRFTNGSELTLARRTEDSESSSLKHLTVAATAPQSITGTVLTLLDPGVAEMSKSGCVFQERLGWERPGWFAQDGPSPVLDYDYYGSYENKKHESDTYGDKLKMDYTFGFPKHHEIRADPCFCLKRFKCRASCACRSPQPSPLGGSSSKQHCELDGSLGLRGHAVLLRYLHFAVQQTFCTTHMSREPMSRARITDKKRGNPLRLHMPREQKPRIADAADPHFTMQ
ncbi:hypothetical protein HPB47_010099 [Ixodes persulcatus]|uniref:Uncharacterized protein n=1 Tax=Ixodes persulcatus TaxID=34615 RepID=A0AC60P0E6_IXOPE|nr:hypothetical protein HPB47_010099 [Ixodes persulcatus]